MADRALFIGWNRPARGREQQAMQLWQKAMAYYAKLQSDGKSESFEPVILAAHGGDLNGFVMIRGSAKSLAEVREEATFFDLTIEANHCLDGFGIVSGYIGEGISEVLSTYTKLIGG